MTDWLTWFLSYLVGAFHGAVGVLTAVIAKAQFWEPRGDPLLPKRQIKLLHYLLNGFEGEMASSKGTAIAKCSQYTANRNIAAPLDLGPKRKGKVGGPSTSHEMVN